METKENLEQGFRTALGGFNELQITFLNEALDQYRQWAIDWLTRSNLALGNVTPASLLSSVASIARVRVLIWKVENGVCL